MTKFVEENIYSHGRDKISNLVNGLLCEFLVLTPLVILTNLLCEVNINLLLGELFPKINLYFIMESR